MLKKLKRFKLDYVVYLLLFVVFITFATLLIPAITNWGIKILEIVTAILLLSYGFIFLLPKLNNKRPKLVLGFTFFEFLLLIVIAILNILSQFNVVSFGFDIISLSLGLSFMLRGLTELVSDYASSEHKKKFIYFVLDLAIYSFGLFLLIKPILTKTQFLYILIAVIYALGLLFLYLFFMLKPKGKKKGEKNEG